MPTAHRYVSRRTDPGSSTAAYSSCNLATHVGDDPVAVLRNRELLAAAVGLPPVAWMDQVHGAEVVAVTGPPAAPPVADALVTDRPGIALAVMVADCLPVLLSDEEAGVIGVAHAGRRGVALGVVPATVAAMVALGARAASTSATLGPCIGPCCYEVGPDVHAEVTAVEPAAAASTSSGALALDLQAAVSAQLERCGVSWFDVDPRCTVEQDDLYSYRRDGVTGRFAGFAWLA